MKRLAIVRGNCFNKVILERYKPIERYVKVKYYATQDNASGKAVPVKTYHNLFLRGLGLHYYQPSIIKELDRFKPDLVNSIELYNSYSYLIVKWALRNKKKSIVFCWETLPKHPAFTKTLFRRYFTKYVVNNANAFQVMTYKSQKCLIELGVKKERIIKQNYGVDNNRFKPGKNNELRKKLGLKKKTVVFVGRLTYEKGIKQLLEAFEKIKDHELLIIGDGDLRGLVELKARNNIKYIGRVPHEKIHEYFNCGHLLCLPSIPHKLWEEQFGEVIAQGMSCGLPVITTNSGAIPEIISEKEGMLIKPANIEELKEGIIKLLNDDKLRRLKSKNARIRALKDYSFVKNNRLLYREYKKRGLL